MEVFCGVRPEKLDGSKPADVDGVTWSAAAPPSPDASRHKQRSSAAAKHEEAAESGEAAEPPRRKSSTPFDPVARAEAIKRRSSRVPTESLQPAEPTANAPPGAPTLPQAAPAASPMSSYSRWATLRARQGDLVHQLVDEGWTVMAEPEPNRRRSSQGKISS